MTPSAKVGVGARARGGGADVSHPPGGRLEEWRGGVSLGEGGGGLTGLNRRHSPVLLLHTGEVNKSIPGAGRGLSYLPPCCYCCLPPTQMVGLPFSPLPSHPRDASLRPDGGSLGAIVVCVWGGGGGGGEGLLWFMVTLQSQNDTGIPGWQIGG